MKKAIWIIVTVIIIGGLVALLIVQAKKPGKYDQFAQCLGTAGAKFYGAWWCPHCQAEKALFGKAAKKLPYIECQTKSRVQTDQCNAENIQGYPTWIFADGSRETGEVKLETLAAKTNCQLPQ